MKQQTSTLEHAEASNQYSKSPVRATIRKKHISQARNRLPYLITRKSLNMQQWLWAQRKKTMINTLKQAALDSQIILSKSKEFIIEVDPC